MTSPPDDVRRRRNRMPGNTVAEKLALNVEASPSGCLLWTGALTAAGYGSLYVAGRVQFVHRVAYELAKGPIPAGLELDHLCRTKSCILVDHLEAVTHAENVRRAYGDHCPRGHPKTPENRSASVSRCLVCARIQDKARYELKKAAAEPVIDVRWQCPHGHFVAFAAIQCEDQRDDFAYHGIRSVCSYDCRACGETHHEMPRAVVVGGAS